MQDVVLVTADSVRHDYVGEMEFVSSHDVIPGVTAAHYTRPSLSALLTSSYLAAAKTQPVGTTLASAMAAAGYNTIGLAPGPMTDPAFGFADGFDQYESFFSGDGGVLQKRTSPVREFLGQFEVVRWAYRLVSPMGAVLENLPSDAALVDEAIDRFNATEPPRFMWLHLVESHRPYGTGEDALPTDLDRKAETSGATRFLGGGEITDDEAALIERKYRDALGRVDGEIRRLLEGLDADPTFVFTSDHGEELGEEGYYYHQGYRRRVPERVVRVPVVVDGADYDATRGSLIDLAPTLLRAVGADPPGEWQGRPLQDGGSNQTLTVAPWHRKATVLWQDFQSRIVCRDADLSFDAGDGVTEADRTEVSEELERRLRDLGYVGAG